MKENKFLYSKCPNCKRHGITAFLKTYELRCKYCGTLFRTYRSIRRILIVFVALIVGVLGYIIKNYVCDIPLAVFFVVAVIAVLVVGYFEPVYEIEEDLKKSYHQEKRRKKK